MFTELGWTSPSYLKTFMSKTNEVNCPKNCNFLPGSVSPLAIKGVQANHLIKLEQ